MDTLRIVADSIVNILRTFTRVCLAIGYPKQIPWPVFKKEAVQGIPHFQPHPNIILSGLYPIKNPSYIPMMFPYTMVSHTPWFPNNKKGKLCERLLFVQEKYDFRQRLLQAEESLKYLTHRLVIVWQWWWGGE